MRLFLLKYHFVYAFLFLVMYDSYSQTTLTLKKGTVIDSLVVPATGNTFSIYLPTSFDLDKNWPVLLGFDATGNTKDIAKVYKDAAEEFGYIVAISNFLENQKEKEKIAYIPVFMNHIFSLFPIQKGRAYVAGMGEDAKLVSLLPAVYAKDIFGILAIGDTHQYIPAMKIGKSFYYMGIVNMNTHNYRDFLDNKTYLKSRAVPADVLVYEGDDELPDQELIKKALSTFTLQAMLKGRMPKDTAWVENLFQEDLKHITSYFDKGEFLYAHDEVKRIRLKYSMFFDTNHLKEKQKEIKKLKRYRRQKRLQTKYLNRENFLRELYLFSIEEDIEEERYENMGWWQYQISTLDTLSQSKERYAYAMASRMKGYLKQLVDSFKISYTKDTKNLEKRMFLNILSTVIDKKDFESYKSIISLSTQDQDYQTALFYLERMLQNGYKDLDSLYTIEGTLAIKMTRDYNKLIEKYLGTSKYFFSK